MDDKPLKWIAHGQQRRAKRSDPIDEDCWEQFKEVLYQKYIEDDLSMRELVPYMETNFDLVAT